MTRRPPLPLLVLALLAPALALLTAVAAPAAEASCGGGVVGEIVDGKLLCTHGDETPPPGVDTTELPSTEALLEARFGVDTTAEIAEVAVEGAESSEEPAVAAAGTVACVGDGTTGARVQLVYAHASNVDGRYASVLPLLRQYAADVDDIINVSAGRVGDGRRVRFVTNANCLPEVLNITLSSTGDDTFSNTVSELRNKGLTNPDRKYLIFADAAVGICGLGEVYYNAKPEQDNPNNSGRPQYARVDTSCWQYAAAHELLHTMGAVQLNAPNSSKAGHCTDEVDVMCYKDTSTTVTRVVCDRAGQVDCNNNDYFHPNPGASSYLANNWNVARSRYLATGQPPPPPPVTSISVPASGYAGAPIAVRANISTPGSGVVWSSTRPECWFDNPYAASTSWTCPATAQGDAQLTVNVTENAITSPYTSNVALVAPTTKQTMSVSVRSSDSNIQVGQSVQLSSRVVAYATGAVVPGLPVEFQVRPKNAKTWSTIGTDATNRSGIAFLNATPQRNVEYRVRTAYNHTWATTYSSATTVWVSSKLTTTVNSYKVAGYSTTDVTTYATTRLGGKVSPNKAGRIIRLRSYIPERRTWRTIREKRISDNSTYSFRYTPRSRGKHYLRIIKPGDSRNTYTRKTIILDVG